MRNEEKRREEKVKQFRRKAFSLIELSVVLIVLGLLLAAIMKGRDLIRNAEIKKFYNNFIKQWEIVYSAYYDRTGKVLGAPLFIKDSSGKYYAWAHYVGFDHYDSEGSDLGFRNANRFKILDPENVSERNGWIGNLLVASGMELPEINRGYPNLYDLSASDVGKVSVFITFGSDPVAENENLTISKNTTSLDSDGNPVNEGSYYTSAPRDVTLPGQGNSKGNFMLIVNLPYDVAAQIDKFIDGEADGKNGNLVCVKVYSQPVNIENHIWPDVISWDSLDISITADCGGPFGWGGYVDGDNKYYYVTALYKLGI